MISSYEGPTGYAVAYWRTGAGASGDAGRAIDRVRSEWGFETDPHPPGWAGKTVWAHTEAYCCGGRSAAAEEIAFSTSPEANDDIPIRGFDPTFRLRKIFCNGDYPIYFVHKVKPIDANALRVLAITRQSVEHDE